MTIVCSKCRHFLTPNDMQPQCEYPENITTEVTWLKEVKSWKELPQHINKHNDCKWFEVE